MLEQASKVELPPVRGAGYEPAIVILSQSQRETSAIDGAVVGVAVGRRGCARKATTTTCHNGTEDYHQNGY
jgi:hypothetical protein